MSATYQMFGRREIAATEDLRRIAALPRRVWTAPELEQLAADMTRALRTPNGTMHLRPIQALALHDIGTHGGLFGPIRVGGGKTITSLLAAYVLDSKCSVLLLPAALRAKTEHERHELAKHWRGMGATRIMSYEELGRVNGARMIESYRPDLIIADEVHRLKNTKAGVTRRVARWMRENPETRFVAISGTIMAKGLRDFGHILRWALKDGAPIPRDHGELEEWADALDDGTRVNPMMRVTPGALLSFADPKDEGDDLSRARRGFQRRLVETPGVVATSGEDVACSLYISPLEYTPNHVTEANFAKLRETWTTPDDWDLNEATEVWRVSCELALGLHYVWNPRPPSKWMSARRDWFAFVRETLGRSRTLDTPAQVEEACRAGQLGRQELDAWKAVEKTFIPNSEPRWHDDSALLACKAWMDRGDSGIVWCKHGFFAEELAARTGAPYFGAEGKDRYGNELRALADKHRASGTAPPTIVASVQACATGFNLQPWRRNLITASMGPHIWEQLLGRTHRDGQRADTIEVEVLMACAEHWSGWQAALSGARAAADMMGGTQKLLLADITMPTEADVARMRGPRWAKNSARPENDDD